MGAVTPSRLSPVKGMLKRDTEAAMSRFPVWIFLPFLLAPNVATAQTPATLAEGQRVRIAHRCQVARYGLVTYQLIECRESRTLRIDTGQLRAFDRDTLRVRPPWAYADLAIPRAYVAEVWVSEVRKRHVWLGAGIGLLTGAVIGGIIASQSFIDHKRATVVGIIAGAPPGLLVGGIVGALIRTDEWRPVALGDAGGSLELQRDGIGMGLSIAF